MVQKRSYGERQKTRLLTPDTSTQSPLKGLTILSLRAGVGVALSNHEGIAT